MSKCNLTDRNTIERPASPSSLRTCRRQTPAACFAVLMTTPEQTDQSDLGRASETHGQQRAANTRAGVAFHRAHLPCALIKAAGAVGGRDYSADQRQPDLPGMRMTAQIYADACGGGAVNNIRTVSQ